MNNERNSGENRKPMSEKRRVKKQINHVMRGIFLYNVIILFVVVADMIIKTVGVILEYPGGPGQDAAIDALLAKLLNSGSSSIVAVLIGTAFLLLYFRKDRLLEPMLAPAVGGAVYAVCLSFDAGADCIFRGGSGSRGGCQSVWLQLYEFH